MKKFEEMSREERSETVALFANWLKKYTHDVIVKVLKKQDEIINNPFTMNMLKELKEREEKERKDFADSIGNMMRDFGTFGQYNPHNHCITHSGSYRDVLYDMYIR